MLPGYLVAACSGAEGGGDGRWKGGGGDGVVVGAGVGLGGAQGLDGVQG